MAAQIQKNDEKVVFEKEMFAPIVEAKTNITINFTGEYKTSRNEVFKFGITKKVRIYPLPELVVIYHEFDKYLNDSDKARIIVYVENKRNTALDNVNVTEIIPQSVTFIEGNMKNIVDIGPKRKMQMYVYTVQTTEKNKTHEITTTLKFSEGDKEYSLTQPIHLNITSKAAITQKSNSSVTKDNANKVSVDNSTIKKANNTDTAQKESAKIPVKRSLWKRFILWIDGFF